MQTNELELAQLRAAVQNNALPASERRDAATHLVRLMVEAVPAPSDDDVEVRKLMQPWRRDTPASAYVASVWEPASLGLPLPEAKAAVQRQRNRKALAEIAADPSEDQIIRDAAKLMLCQTSSGVLRRT